MSFYVKILFKSNCTTINFLQILWITRNSINNFQYSCTIAKCKQGKQKEHLQRHNIFSNENLTMKNVFQKVFSAFSAQTQSSIYNYNLYGYTIQVSIDNKQVSNCISKQQKIISFPSSLSDKCTKYMYGNQSLAYPTLLPPCVHQRLIQLTI